MIQISMVRESFESSCRDIALADVHIPRAT